MPWMVTRALGMGLLCVGLTACGQSRPLALPDGGTPPPGAPRACTADDLCAGAARIAVAPTDAHIAGVSETRLGLGTRTQRFNLGGFGLNPTQNLPNPFAALGENLTEPASAPTHFSAVHQEEEPLYLRLMLLTQGDTRVLFVTLDAIGAGNLIQEGLRQRLVALSCAQDLCIDADDIVFGQTHSHAGPDLQGLWGGVPQDWIDNTFYAGAETALMQALQAREPVSLAVAEGRSSDFNNYRRPRIDPEDDADDHLVVLRARAEDGRVVAQILQYAAHPTSINEDPRVPHPDYVLGAVKRLEQAGGVGLYFNGPIADASGAGGACDTPEPDAYERVRCRGNDLAALASAQAFRPLAPSLAIRHQTVTLPVTNPAFLAVGALGSFNRYYNFTPRLLLDLPLLGGLLETVTGEVAQVALTADTLVSRVSIGGPGGLEIATIPGEATNTFGEFIRGLSAQANPDATVMLLGLTQNSFGYILPEEEFSYIDPTGEAGFLVPFTGYEEFVSLGPLSAPLLRLQGYIPLFDAPPAAAVPDYLRGCVDPEAGTCLLVDIALRLESIQGAYADRCREASVPEAFCGLLDPDTPLAPVCLSLNLPAAVCGLLGDPPEA